MEKTICTGQHSEHICQLAEKRQMEKIKQLTNAPQFLCANCGRAANSDENLCNPVDIGQAGFEGI